MKKLSSIFAVLVLTFAAFAGPTNAPVQLLHGLSVDNNTVLQGLDTNLFLANQVLLNQAITGLGLGGVSLTQLNASNAATYNAAVTQARSDMSATNAAGVLAAEAQARSDMSVSNTATYNSVLSQARSDMSVSNNAAIAQARSDMSATNAAGVAAATAQARSDMSATNAAGVAVAIAQARSDMSATGAVVQAAAIAQARSDMSQTNAAGVLAAEAQSRSELNTASNIIMQASASTYTTLTSVQNYLVGYGYHCLLQWGFMDTNYVMGAISASNNAAIATSETFASTNLPSSLPFGATTNWFTLSGATLAGANGQYTNTIWSGGTPMFGTNLLTGYWFTNLSGTYVIRDLSGSSKYSSATLIGVWTDIGGGGSPVGAYGVLQDLTRTIGVGQGPYVTTIGGASSGQTLNNPTISGGTFSGSLNISSNTLYVARSGIDATALVGDVNHPWQSLNVLSAATNGQMVRLGYGAFPSGSNATPVIQPGVSIKGEGPTYSTIPSVQPGLTPNCSLQDLMVNEIKLSPTTNNDNNLYVNNCVLGTYSGIDVITGPCTNAVINNSTLLSGWDVDALVVGNDVWNNDTISLTDTQMQNYSAGMHAHYIEGDNTTLTINGGTVNIWGTRPASYFVLGANAWNAAISSQSTAYTNVTVRINGLVFNHTNVANGLAITLLRGFGGTCTNVYGWYWDNGVLTFVAGTNIYQPIVNGTLYGNGSGLSNVASVSGDTYQTTTNFLTRNTAFVDAGNGNDLFDGSADYPWATIAYAQTHTPTGWTLAVAPGNYSDTVTNIQLNYYLSFGATVHVNYTGAGTNNLSGQGTVQIYNGAGEFGGYMNLGDASGAGYPAYANQVCNLSGYMFDGNTNYENYYINQGENTTYNFRFTVVTNLSIIGAQNNPGNSWINFDCDDAYIAQLQAGGDYPPAIRLHAAHGIHFQSGGTISLDPDSVLSTSTITLTNLSKVTQYGLFSIGSCQIDAGRIICSTNLLFGGEYLTGYPIVSSNITGTVKGEYQRIP